jgi:hypothetical protein
MHASHQIKASLGVTSTDCAHEPLVIAKCRQTIIKVVLGRMSKHHRALQSKEVISYGVVEEHGTMYHYCHFGTPTRLYVSLD